MLGKLAKRPFFTSSEAKKIGVSNRMLSYYLKNGDIERLARGVYRSTSYECASKEMEWEDLAIAAKNIRGGVICLVSALRYYELSDDMMREFWIAVDNANSKAKFPMSRIIRMRNMELGVTSIQMAGMSVQIFDKERTVIDSFRHLDFETAIKALKAYLNESESKPDLNKLDRYITELRASKVRDYLMALVA